MKNRQLASYQFIVFFTQNFVQKKFPKRSMLSETSFRYTYYLIEASFDEFQIIKLSIFNFQLLNFSFYLLIYNAELHYILMFTSIVLHLSF